MTAAGSTSTPDAAVPGYLAAELRVFRKIFGDLPALAEDGEPAHGPRCSCFGCSVQDT